MSGCIKADRADGLIWLHITRIGFQDAEAAGNLLQKFFTRLLPGQAALIARSGTGDRLMYRTVLRQIRQANVNERVCVRNDKSGALNRSKKDRRIDAFIAVVNDRILVGVLDRKFWMAGAQAGPDLCQDPGPIAVPIMIADIAGQRRNKSGADYSCPRHIPHSPGR